MALNYESLPAQLLALLQAGRVLTVRWDCGNDESIVTTLVDGVEQPFDLGAGYMDFFLEHRDMDVYLSRITNLPVLLDGFLTERLGLPSVGEFSMRGTGRIFQEGAAIVLDYQSDATSWDDEPDPANWLPEYYLGPAELAELFPERVGAEVGAPGPLASRPDPQMSADYSGHTVLFQLG
ncbi:MAG: hypothetical protein ACRYFX_01960 [Janthinobacterium lividum]